METDNPIEPGSTYRDTDNGLYVKVAGMHADVDGVVQVHVEQYTDLPMRAHNSAGYVDWAEASRTVTLEDVRERILSGELIYEGK